MRIDWVPFSASALVAGATALSVGALLMPSSEDSSDSLRIVQEQGGQWMAVAGLYFFASVALVVGLPSVLTLFDKRGSRTGLTALAVFTIGCVGIAGFAMLLAFFRAVALNDTIDVVGGPRVETPERATGEAYFPPHTDPEKFDLRNSSTAIRREEPR